MKMINAWYVMWTDGTKWLVDCPREIGEHRKRIARDGSGHKIITIRKMGKRASCTACNLNMHTV